MLRRNWAAEVERPTVTAHEATSLDAVQLQALLKAAEASGSRYALLFQLLALTGLRRGEALALRWESIRPDGKPVIRVSGTLARIDGVLVVTQPKTSNSRRDLFITKPIDAVLRALKQRQRKEQLKAGSLWTSTGYVFTTETGQPCDPRNALRALHSAATKAGLSGVGLHTLRHTAATLMLGAGVPILTVSGQLGHYSVSITGDVYGHVSDEASASAMGALAKAVAGSQR